jgi:hypothetical protein
MPIDGAEALAQAFALAEPKTVAIHLANEEMTPEKSPGFALARKWASATESEMESLQREVGRLYGLVLRAADTLLAAGLESEAANLRRSIGDRSSS